jgi:N-acylneuraminate cytidylyltransferase
MTAVAIIPARGGSKRLPRKNIRPMGGVPIMKYAIDAALESGCYDEVMVSTDDAEIADVARSLGAQVPFIRSAENSNDYNLIVEVIEEVMGSYRDAGRTFERFTCIYPTAVFVTAQRLRESFALLDETGADGVVPVCVYGHPVLRSLKIETGRLVMNWPENYQVRSQDLPELYFDAGQFYSMRTESLLTQRTLYAEHTVPLVIPETEAQDIDTEEDWTLAELKFQRLKSTGER